MFKYEEDDIFVNQGFITLNGAAVAGYRFGGDMVDVSVGAFNGVIDEVGKDYEINSFVASVAAMDESKPASSTTLPIPKTVNPPPSMVK